MTQPLFLQLLVPPAASPIVSSSTSSLCFLFHLGCLHLLPILAASFSSSFQFHLKLLRPLPPNSSSECVCSSSCFLLYLFHEDSHNPGDPSPPASCSTLRISSSSFSIWSSSSFPSQWSLFEKRVNATQEQFDGATAPLGGPLQQMQL